MITSIKTCFKCQEDKPLGEFYKHSEMSDGHLGKCKACTKVDVKEHRELNIDRVREYDRSRGNRQPEEYQRLYRAANKEKYAAHGAVNNAIRDGSLTKEPCEICGDLKVHGHHEDYNKPLEVVWLCPAHHRQRHTQKEII